MTPPWHFALLTLLTFRVWKLLADDEILDGPRNWVLSRLDARWELFITCPWCAGFWLSGAALGLYALSGAGEWPGWLVGAGLWFALSGAVGLLATVMYDLRGE